MEVLKILGLIFILIGAAVLVGATSLVPASMVSVGPVSVDGVSELNATRIIIAVVFVLLGLVLYIGKEGLKVFAGK